MQWNVWTMWHVIFIFTFQCVSFISLTADSLKFQASGSKQLITSSAHHCAEKLFCTDPVLGQAQWATAEASLFISMCTATSLLSNNHPFYSFSQLEALCLLANLPPYHYELWLLTERIRSQVQVMELSFLSRLAGHTRQDGISGIQESLRIELLHLWINVV